MNGGTATVVNSTIARNSDVTGVHRTAGSLDVTNSIIYYNNAESTQCGAVAGQVGGTVTITYSNVQGGYPGVGNIAIFEFFETDDCDCPDYRIVLISPSVDAGNPAAEFNDECFPPSHGGPANDMGAHGGPGACDWDCWDPADLNCDRIVGIVDFLMLLAAWGPCADCENCPADLDCDCNVGIIDFLLLLEDWS